MRRAASLPTQKYRLNNSQIEKGDNSPHFESFNAIARH